MGVNNNHNIYFAADW